jgi:DNA polymerase III sliding clamp (beta) subunit (PCNA family)
LLPREIAIVLQQCLRHDESVTLYRDDSKTSKVIVGPYSLIFSTSDDHFPPISQVVPTTHEIIVVIDRKELSAVVKRLRKLAPESGIVFSTIKDKLNVRLSSDEPNIVREVLEPITIKAQGGSRIDIGFNMTYFLEALTGGDTVELQLNGALDPMVVRQEKRFAVVMPMRI